MVQLLKGTLLTKFMELERNDRVKDRPYLGGL